jgi:hypothetical protein
VWCLVVGCETRKSDQLVNFDSIFILKNLTNLKSLKHLNQQVQGFKVKINELIRVFDAGYIARCKN